MSVSVITDTTNDDAMIYKSFGCAQTALKKMTCRLLGCFLSLPHFLPDGDINCDPNEFQKIVSGLEIKSDELIILVFPDVNLRHGVVVSSCR